MYQVNKLNVAKTLRILAVSVCACVAYVFMATAAQAATLSLSPSTGVYTSNSTFTARVSVNSAGQSINAAEGVLSFNPKELAVVSVNRSGSIFNLWVTEPTFSNGAGTISFSGGLPSGYTGSAGTVMSVTFRAVGSGTARVNFASGSVLANDGRGTNVLTGMNGGNYTIQAASSAPVPEEIEYVAPANTPAAPVVKSDTHPDPAAWYANKEAVLNWELPSGIVSVRTLLDDRSTSVPTKVYDTPIRTITLSDLEEGVSYFHVQFKNADGWGKIAHYRLAIDTARPTAITISQPEGADLNNPEQSLVVAVEDETSDVKRFMVKVDSAEPFEFLKETSSSTVTLPALEPGYHTVIIEAIDEAGNSVVGSYSITIESFERPVFTEYPSEINEEVIPVIKGNTRPNATVKITLSRISGEPSVYEVASDAEGKFTFIPEGRFSTGVYTVTAQATDQYGAMSEVSDPIRIAVQQPGYLRIGSFIVSLLSVVIPLILLTALTIIGSWYLVIYMRRFRKQIRKESNEALEILRREFASLQEELRRQEAAMQESRKTKKLSKAEADMIEAFDRSLQNSQRKVEKEIEDVTRLTNRSNK